MNKLENRKNRQQNVSFKGRNYRRLKKKSDWDIVKDSFKIVSKEYCAESSLCGLKHLVSDDTSLVERYNIKIANLFTLPKARLLQLETIIKNDRVELLCYLTPFTDYFTDVFTRRAIKWLGRKHYFYQTSIERVIFIRIIWIIILITGLACSVSLVWMTFTKYYRAPLVTTQMPEGVSVSKIIFPALGICSNNRISKRAATELAKILLLEERNMNYTDRQMMSLLLGLGQLYDMQPMDEDAIVQPMELHIALGEYDVHELIKSLTPRCEDLLIRCVWNTEPKHCNELFDFRLTVNGYCCTFNYLRLSDKTFRDKKVPLVSDFYNFGNKSTFDFDQGLLVLLRLNETDDFFYNMPLQGAQLQFSDAYDFPDGPSGSFSMQIISPSMQMTVLVSASFTKASRDIQHVPVELRKCRFYDESDYLPYYTHSDCILKCRMEFLLNKCNCTPFNMLKYAKSRACDMSDVVCLRTYYAQSITVRPNVDPVPPELELEMMDGGIDCPMCSPTCSKTTYNYDFNNVILYPEYLNAVPDDDRDEWLRGANFTGASIVHVKYAREVADNYEQNVIMKWFDLISNIGSTCGFVTGFSFVSVLEFIYFFTIKFIREVRKRRAKIHLASTVEVNDTGLVARYRPIYWNELTQSTQFANHVKLKTSTKQLKY